MKTSIRKLLSILCAGSMLLSYVPAPAFAADEALPPASPSLEEAQPSEGAAPADAPQPAAEQGTEPVSGETTEQAAAPALAAEQPAENTPADVTPDAEQPAEVPAEEAAQDEQPAAPAAAAAEEKKLPTFGLGGKLSGTLHAGEAYEAVFQPDKSGEVLFTLSLNPDQEVKVSFAGSGVSLNKTEEENGIYTFTRKVKRGEDYPVSLKSEKQTGFSLRAQEAPKDESAEESTEEVQEEAADNNADNNEEKSEDTTEEKPAEETQDEPAEDTKKETVEETEEKPAEETKEETAEETQEEIKEEAEEKSAEETKEELTEETKEEIKEEAEEKPVEETKEEIKEEAEEEPTEETKEEPAEETKDEHVEETKEEPAENKEQSAEETEEKPAEEVKPENAAASKPAEVPAADDLPKEDAAEDEASDKTEQKKDELPAAPTDAQPDTDEAPAEQPAEDTSKSVTEAEQTEVDNDKNVTDGPQTVDLPAWMNQTEAGSVVIDVKDAGQNQDTETESEEKTVTDAVPAEMTTPLPAWFQDLEENQDETSVTETEAAATETETEEPVVVSTPMPQWYQDTVGNEETPTEEVTEGTAESAEETEEAEGTEPIEEPAATEEENLIPDTEDVLQAPAGTMKLSGPDYTVIVTVTEDAGLPAGTRLSVTEIAPGSARYRELTGNIDDVLSENWNKIDGFARLFDITFIYEGEELEPFAPVDVQIIFPEQIVASDEDKEVKTLHINDNGNTEVINASDSGDAVTFSADQFSVYAVVAAGTLTQTITARGTRYNVMAKYGAEAEIPKDATLQVTEITSSSELYDAFQEKAAQAMGSDDASLVGLYDISIWYEGEKVQPAEGAAVTVSIRPAERLDASELQVVHFQDTAATDAPDTLPDGQVISDAEVTRFTVTFDADGFSVFALAYTVDYTYEDKEYHMQGETSMLLSELFTVLNINADIANVKSVSFTDETLLTVEQIEGNWLLTSQQPFTSNETLTVIMNDGTVYRIAVTDAQSTDLRDFLTSATIVAPTNEQGAYVVEPGTEYNINLSFKETPSNQFDNVRMTYPIPAGLDADGHNGTFSVNINRGGQDYVISGNRFSVENGVLTVEWNQDDPNYNQLTASANVKFNLALEGKFDESAKEIAFSDSIKKEVVIDTSNSVTASKIGNVDISNNKIWYTVNVQSTGTSTNVKVTDTITGTGITLDPASIKANYNDVPLEWNLQTNGNTFDFTIPKISNGETVTIQYAADIDPSLLEVVDGKVVTQSGNKFKATSDGDPEGDEVEVKNTIDYTPKINKSSGTVVGTKGTKQILEWTLTVNPEQKVSAAGTKVTDEIGADSKNIMTYAGDGITVHVYDTDGTLVRTDNKKWNELNSKTNSAWQYTIPAEDKGHAYKYEIIYNTEVETDDLTKLTTVTNTGYTDGGGNPAQGSGQVSPANGPIELSKQLGSIDKANKEVTWIVTFSVPAKGLSKAVVTDNYPTASLPTGQAYEKVKQGSVQITGLVEGENYTIEYGETAAVITFTKDGTNPGLQQTTSARTIIVTLKTEIDEDWVQASKGDGSWRMDHINNVKLDPGSDVLTSSATAKIAPSTVTKKSSVAGKRTVDGVELPVYKFEVVLTGVEEDSFTIEDTFDTELLEPLIGTVPGIDTWDNGYMLGGDQYYQGNKGSSPVSYLNTTTGMTFQVTADSLPKVDGKYYTGYKLVYYLTVKNEAALTKIMQRAAESADGIYKIENMAEWEGETGTTVVPYAYEGLTKEILTSDADLKKTDAEIKADFRITLNPAGAMLNGGESMTLTDTVTNLSVDITSIQATPSEGVTWDMTGDEVTYTIPDGVKVVITYSAKVVFKTIGETGETVIVPFSNYAEMKGYHSEVKKQAERHNSGAGTGTVPSINLMKYEAGNMTKRLSGAKFQLLDADKKPVKNNAGEELFFTTGTDGMIKVEGDQEADGWALAEDTYYFLREIEAPLGYKLADFDYSFMISSNGTTDYSSYIYHSNDTMSAKNYPGTDVEVKKEWSDGNEKHNSDEVTIKLQQKIGEGEWSDTIRDYVKNGDSSVWTDVTEGKKITLNKENDWQGAFNGLPLRVPVSLSDPDGDDVEVDYQVVETLVNGKAPEEGSVKYELERSSGTYVDGDGQQQTFHGAYKYTVKNEVTTLTGGLSVEKEVTGNAGDKTKDFAFTITLVGPQNLSGEYGKIIRKEGHDAETKLDFTNNVATFTLRDGEKAIAENIPVGFVYTVSEENYSGEYYTTTIMGNKSSLIVAGETPEIRFINDKQVGGLSVEKTVTGNAGDKTKDFEFTIKLTGEPKLSGTYGTITRNSGHTAGTDLAFTNNIATFTLQDGEKVVAENIPVGFTYEVSEKDYSGDYYTTTSTENTKGTISASSRPEVKFTNDKQTGGLSVEKKVTGNAGSTTKDFSFLITLAGTPALNGDYGTIERKTDHTGAPLVVSFASNEARFTLRDGEKATLTGIPAGFTYTVSETSYESDGYTTTAEGKINGSISADVTPSIVFTNERNATGGLQFNKVIGGNAASADDSFHFIVTVDGNDVNKNGTYSGKKGETASDVTFTNGVSAIITLKGGENQLITGLPVGTAFTVKEVDADGRDLVKPDGADTYDAGNGYVSDQVVAQGTITEGTATRTFTNVKNTYSDLVIRKNVGGNSGDTNKEFTFVISLTKKDGSPLSGTFDSEGKQTSVSFDENGKATVKLKHEETLLIKNLPNGAYYVVAETAESGYSTSILRGYTDINGSDHTTGLTPGITTPKTQISGDAVQTYSEYYGNFKDNYGELKIVKAVTGNAASASQGKKFPVKVTLFTDQELKKIDTGVNGNADTYGVAFVEGVATFEVTPGQPVLLKHLPHQDWYQITEPGDYSPTYSIAVRKKDGVPVYEPVFYITNGVGQIDAGKMVGDDMPTITVTNEVNEYGGLSVQKTVDSQMEADKTRDYNFSIYLYPEDTSADSVQYDGVTFLKVTNAPSLDESGNKNSTAYKYDFTLKHNETKIIKKIDVNLPYYVEEITEGYLTTYSPAQKGTIQPSPDSDYAPLIVNTITVINKQLTGELTVTKQVTGEVDSSLAFEIHVKFPDGPVSGKLNDTAFSNLNDIKVMLKHGESATITDIPVGTRYEVSETLSEEQYSGYAKETIKYSDPEQTVKADVKGLVTVVNKKESFGGIQVRKVTGGNDPDKKTWFAVRIEISDKTFNGTVKAKRANENNWFDLKFVNGVSAPTDEQQIPWKPEDSGKLEDSSLAIAKDKELTIIGLPAGVTYTVAEELYTDTYDSQTIAYGNSSQTVKALFYNDIPTDAKELESIKAKIEEAQNIATVTNIRNRTGKLVLTKIIDGNDISESDTFTFEISTSPKVTGTYSGVTFDAEGKATVQLSGAKISEKAAQKGLQAYEPSKNGGVTIVIEGLPLRTEFTVTETKTNGYKPAYTLLYRSKVMNPTDEEKAEYKYWNGTDWAIDDKGNVPKITQTKPNTNQGVIDVDQRIVVITNTRDTYGSLSVSKQVTGNGGDTTKTFDFSITFYKDAGLQNKATSADIPNGTYGQVYVKDGEVYASEMAENAGVSLKHGEQIRLENLPNGLYYKVVETDYSDDGYETTVTTTGTVGADGRTVTGRITGTRVDAEAKPEKVHFTNTRNVTGSMKIGKKLGGNDPETDVSFELSLSTDPVFTGKATLKDGTELVFDQQGKASLFLKGGDTVEISGIPNKTTVTVTEIGNMPAGHTETTYSPKDGKVQIDETNPLVSVEVTNVRDTFGELEVAKKVTGEGGDTTKTFDFSITFYKDAGLQNKATAADIPNGTYGNAYVKDGEVYASEAAVKAGISLKHGEQILLDKLPNGLYYKVEETGNYPGYTATVKNGQASAEGATTSGQIAGNKKAAVEFTNTYSAAPVKAQIWVTKKLTGRDWIGTDSFTFELRAVDGAPVPTADAQVTVDKGTPNKAFGAITFTEKGEYKYQVAELQGNVPGMTYDLKPVAVTVSVTDDGEGELHAEVTTAGTETNPVEITNTYNAEGNAAIPGTKTLENRNFQTGDSLQVTIAAQDPENAPLPKNTTLNVPLSTDKNTAEFSFGPIHYDLAVVGAGQEKTFTYLVTETPVMESTTADSRIHTVKVTVKDDYSGKLKISYQFLNGEETGTKVAFLNTYETVMVEGRKIWADQVAHPENVTISLYKTIDGSKVLVESRTVGKGENDTKDQWSYSFGPLPKYIGTTKTEVPYSVEEAPVEGFLTAIDGYQITNTPTNVTILKADGDGNPLAGVVLQLLDGTEVVDEWTTASEAHVIRKLAVGKTYTIHEKKTLPGYKFSPDKAFVLNKQGEIDFKLEAVTAEPVSDSEGNDIIFQNEKATVPSFEKKILDVNDSTDKAIDYANLNKATGWQDSADYDIGDEVPYKLAATTADNVSDYYKYALVFHDEMESSLDFNADSVKVYVNGELQKTDSYELKSEAHAFDLTVTWEAKKTAGKYDSRLSDKLNKAEVCVYFTATLNEIANLGSQGNVNEAYLEYSNNPNLKQEGEEGYEPEKDTPNEDKEKTDHDVVIAFTYLVEINKTNAEGEKLEGAEFKLEKKLENGKWIEVKKDKDQSSDVKFVFKGLDDGDYRLKEIQIPKGYKGVDPITFTVTADHDVVWNATDDTTRKTVLTALTGNVETGEITLSSAKENGTIAGNVKNKPVDKPEFEKKILDVNDSEGPAIDYDNLPKAEGWQDSADYDIGDHVPYRLKATLAEDVSSYYKYFVSFHDKLEEGLTLDKDSIKVYLGSEELKDGEGVKVVKNLEPTDGDSFEVAVTWEAKKTDGKYEKRLDEALNEAKVYVYFTATLNEKANLGSQGNVNEAYLEYSNNPNLKQEGEEGYKPEEDTPNDDKGETPHDFVIAFTYKVEVNKTDAEGKKLEGAEFKLEKKLADDTWIEITKDVKSTDTTFIFKGLDDGDYRLKEIRIPKGYKGVDPITFTVKADHDVVWNATDDTTRKTVLNSLTGDEVKGEITLTKQDEVSGTIAGTVENKPVDTPEFEKKILDVNDSKDPAIDYGKLPDATGWQDSADYDIGDHVPYRLKATLAEDVSSYYKYFVTFHDKLEEVLTLDKDSIKVYLGSKELVTNPAEGITVDINPAPTGGDSFEVTVTWEAKKTNGRYDSRLSEALNKAEVCVYFTATLNEKANLGSQGNVNEAYLEYSNNPNLKQEGEEGYKPEEDTPNDDKGETPHDFVIAFTYKVEVNKTNAEGKELEGAKFKLEKYNKAEKTWTVVPLAEGDSTKTKFVFKGLDDGDYRLKEIRIPNGYKGVDPITFTVTADHDVVWNVTDASTRTSVLTKLTGEKVTGEIELTKQDAENGTIAGTVKNKPVDTPEFEKKILDVNDSTDPAIDYGKLPDATRWQDSADYDIGDRVPYRLKATLAEDVSSYYKYFVSFHDKLEEGLTLDKDSIKVYLGSKELVTNPAEGVTVDVNKAPADGDSFEVKVTWEAKKSDGKRYDSRLDEALNKAEVNVYFTATLNEKANLGSQGNVNEAYLTYSNNPNLKQEGEDDYTPDEDTPNEDDDDKGETPHDFVIAFTYKVEVKKTDAEGKELEGAKFQLQKKLADGTLADVALDAKESNGSTFVFRGLDDGDYVLTETNIPLGYKAIDPIAFTVNAEHAVEWTNVSDRLTVLNSLTGDVTSGEVKLTLAEQKTMDTLTTAVVNEEATVPSFEKKILDVNDSTDKAIDYANLNKATGWQDSADYDIGDEVPYELTATTADNVTDYTDYFLIFHDRMEDGLTFNADSVKVYVNGEPVKDGEYALEPKAHSFDLTVSWEGESDGKGNIIGRIADDRLNGAEVKVYFTATLNKDAIVGGHGNVNTAWLEYTNNPNVDESGKPIKETDKTPLDAVIAFTYQTDITKVDENGDPLKGAEFELVKIFADGTEKTVTNFTVEDESVFRFKGLDDGEYWLKETKAPEGYVPVEPLSVTVAANHNEAWPVAAETDANMNLLPGRDQVMIRLNGTLGNGILNLEETDVLTGRVENTPKETSATIRKIWDDEENRDGLRPASIVFSLLKTVDGETVPTGKTATLTAANRWTQTIAELPEAEGGSLVTYSWSEPKVAAYASALTTKAGTLTVFTNTHAPEETEVSVEKVWNDRNNASGERPEAITVQLYADGKAEGAPVTLNAGNGWKTEWKNLKKNANVNGHVRAIAYTVAETKVPAGYIAKVTGSAAKGFVITNTLEKGNLVIEKTFDIQVPEPEPEVEEPVTNIEVRKVWDDGDNADGIRPASITVHLFAGGTEVASRRLTAANGWSTVFAELPKFVDGHPISYRVTEDPVPGYTTEINGFTITNHYTPETTQVSVRKVWDDENDKRKIRPEKVVMQLSNGTKVVLSAQNGWQATVSGLPAKANGEVITYTWTEKEVIGYELEDVSVKDGVTVFTNKPWERPEKPEKGRKPRNPGDPLYIFEEYDTPLGVEIVINHVGDCFD